MSATPVTVVGAGVTGASIAHHPTRAGRAVTILDSGPTSGGVTAADIIAMFAAALSAQLTLRREVFHDGKPC